MEQTQLPGIREDEDIKLYLARNIGRMAYLLGVGDQVSALAISAEIGTFAKGKESEKEISDLCMVVSANPIGIDNAFIANQINYISAIEERANKH